MMNGTIHPFSSSDTSRWRSLIRNVHELIKEPEAKKIFAFLAINGCVTFVLLLWCHSTNSMALTAYAYLTIFNIFSLLTSLLTIWVQRQNAVSVFTFGYERFEVLAVFSSTMLAQLGAFFIAKESVERVVQQPDIHTGRLLLGALVAFCYNILVVYSIKNRPFQHVIEASSSSWLQEHVADMSQSLCHVVPGLSKLLLPRINPLSLLNCAGCLALVTVFIAIDVKSYYSADTWAAIFIAVAICGTMFPMASYTGMILLQTTPSHVIGQLDKLLREASTLDGVLEFRHEHFWTVSFGVLAGSLHVRIRRDANEQMVLAHVTNRLSNLVSILTVQIFKDDWGRLSSYQVISNNPQNITSQRIQTPVENSSLANTSFINSAYKPLPQNSLPLYTGSNQSELIRPAMSSATENMLHTESRPQVGASQMAYPVFKPNYDMQPGIGLGQKVYKNIF